MYSIDISVQCGHEHVACACKQAKQQEEHLRALDSCQLGCLGQGWGSAQSAGAAWAAQWAGEPDLVAAEGVHLQHIQQTVKNTVGAHLVNVQSLA